MSLPQPSLPRPGTGFTLLPTHLQRVDLAIVPQEPHGLRQQPLGCCVGAEAAVVDGKGAREQGVLEVLVELAQDDGAQHALVHDRAGRERAEVELGQGVHARGGHRSNVGSSNSTSHGLLNQLAEDVELTLHVLCVVKARDLGRAQPNIPYFYAIVV